MALIHHVQKDDVDLLYLVTRSTSLEATSRKLSLDRYSRVSATGERDVLIGKTCLSWLYIEPDISSCTA